MPATRTLQRFFLFFTVKLEVIIAQDSARTKMRNKTERWLTAQMLLATLDVGIG